MKRCWLVMAAASLCLGATTPLVAAESPEQSVPGEVAALPEPAPAANSYEIVPKDRLEVRVFGEPELSVAQIPVDARGFITLPLVGEVRAAGLQTSDISRDIAARLRTYIHNPRVTVMVTAPAERTFVIEGQVTQPGVYPLSTKPTLLTSVAQAQGTTRVAKLKDVFIFREIAGERYAARFDLRDIRNGVTADPRILPDDTIVVGFSQSQALIRDFLSVAPLLTAVFVRLN